MSQAKSERTKAEEIVEKISNDIDADREKILDFFVKMLRIKSVNPSMGGPGEIERANFIQSYLDKEGFRTERVDVPDPGFSGHFRPNVSAKIEGADKMRTLWFLAHTDTVPEGSRELWKSDPFDPVIKDGKIFARGAEDNGQSLVSSLFALRALQKNNVKLPFNVGIWAVADEEFGSKYGVKYLLEHDYFRADDLIIVPDSGSPEGRAIEVAEKNLLWFKITTRGKQVHASTPGHGKNAHRIGMDLAMRLDKVFHEKYTKTNDMYDVPSSTFEPTKVEPNVPNINTVPGVDVFYFDCRVLPEYSLDSVISDIHVAIEEVESKFGAKIEFEIINREDAGPVTSSTSEVAVTLQRSVTMINGNPGTFIGIGGQTVGNLFRKKGFPTVVWSTIDDVPHEPNEYSRFENLIFDAKVFASMPLLYSPSK